jgi:hypothetical protein
MTSPIDGMNPGAPIFLYTPFPYWGVFVLVLYRHDLSRLFHPFRDDGSPIKWWSVLNHMGLLGTGKAARPRSIRGVLPYLALFAVSAVVSLSWTFGLFPPFYCYLIIVQGISAIILAASTIQYLGQPPRRPYVDVLRYPRLGSRIRHIRQISQGRRENEPSREPQEVQK